MWHIEDAHRTTRPWLANDEKSMQEPPRPEGSMKQTWHVLGSIGPLFSDGGLKNWELLLGRDRLLARPLGIGLSQSGCHGGNRWRPGHRSARSTATRSLRLGRAGRRISRQTFLASISRCFIRQAARRCLSGLCSAHRVWSPGSNAQTERLAVFGLPSSGLCGPSQTHPGGLLVHQALAEKS